MPLLLPFLLALGIGIVAYAGRHSAKKTPALTSGQGPSAIAVLDQFARSGRTPPPDVILCAIAEAEALGNADLVDAILHSYVVPVVAEVEAAHQRPPMQPTQSPPPARMPRMMHPAQQPQPQPQRGAAPGHHGQDSAGQAIPIDGDETEAAMRAMRSLAGDSNDLDDGAPTVASGEMFAPPTIVRGELAMSSIGLAQGTRVQRSPIRGVDAARWSAFVSSLVRDDASPSFVSQRHVGQFRHRVDRLSELGIDPESLIGSSEAQIVALERDLADAFKHAERGGLVREYVASSVHVPTGDTFEAYEVTLSGVLGVIQAAGLEGACEWFERPGDRKRFPHTTQVFLRTNGVF